MLHRENMPTLTNTLRHMPAHHITPRAMKPDFRDGCIIEERDRNNNIISRYRIGRLLGKGGFAKCYEGTDLATEMVYAIKVIDRASLIKSKMQAKLHSEIAIHRRMHHPNIVHFYRTFQDEWYVYITLEKCSNQTLMEISRTRARFSKEETQHIMIQSISALQYMHNEDVLHRDLKLGNMMMDENMNVKIGDFGLAAELQFDGERKRTVCGTPNYIAPEILEGARNGHSFEVDVWSLGVILYTLLVGEPPFQTNDVKATYNRIKQCQFHFPSNLTISNSGKELVHMMLQSRPEKRPSLVQVRQHPFFNGAPSKPIAPLSLYTESQRRRMEALRTSTATPTPTVMSVKTSATSVREPLKTIWNGNAATSNNNPITPRDALQRADSGRYTAPTTASEGLGARGRINSVPTMLPVAQQSNKPIANVNGWISKPVTSRPPSPRNAPPAPTTATCRVPPNQNPMDDDEKHHLTAVHDKLHKTFHGAQDADDEEFDLAGPSVWVTDYADFSNKYGLAYRLSTGHTAVHYNDGTKMVWEPTTNRAEYYARVKETINGVLHAQDQRESFNMNTFPESLTKKVTLIKYFHNYLKKSKGKKDVVQVVNCSSFPPVNKSPIFSERNMLFDMIYVKRWLLTHQAMIFRLSNKTIQVCFFDRAEVILSSETKVVTYTDAQGKRITIPLSKAPSQSEEVASRLKHTKDILSELINSKEL
eukprot:Tbor_TRINITY_DN2094_c0_g1::TRINITY_DN2094_c0_g1_i1::g.12139::m.12139/K06631/PLK1; polo-like kinase 1